MGEASGASQPTVPPAGWVDGTRELRFTFGEFSIFTKRLRAWIARPGTVRGVDDLARLPAFAGVPSDVRLLAMQSVPVDGTLPAVTRLTDAIRYVPAHFNHY